MTDPRTQTRIQKSPSRILGPLALCGALVLPALTSGLLAAPASANDPPEVSFSRSSYVMNEGQDTTVTVKKTGSGEAAVNYTTADPASGTNNPATANTDYTPASGQLTFDADETEKTFTVSALTDTDVTESSEGLIVKLSLPDSSDAPETELGSVRQAAVVILNVVPAGSTTTQSGGGSSSDLTVQQCLDAWDDSSASGSCPWIGARQLFRMTVTSDGECSVSTRCTNSRKSPAPWKTVTGSLDDMRNLENCDGRLEIGCIAAAQAAALAALVADCEDAWDENDASQQCGSSYGDHSVTASNQQCEVSTSCGTPAVAASFTGSPDEVKKLDYCDSQLSTSCPAPVTVENCKAAWEASPVTNCLDTVLGQHVVSVTNGPKCAVDTQCHRSSPDPQYIGAWFRGTVEQVKILNNCNGTLKAGSC